MQPALRSDPANGQIFDFEIILDAVFGSLAAEAGGFHAAEGGDLGRDDALVDADDAVFQGFRDAEDAPDIAGVEIGREAEFGVIGELDRLFLGFEAK